MEIPFLIIIVTLLAVLGLINLASQIHRTRSRKMFCRRFQQKLHSYMQTNEYDDIKWLLLNSSKMQIELGEEGFVSYIAPFQTHIVKNYPLILNSIPELRTDIEMGYSRSAYDTYSAIENVIVRHMGSLQITYELIRAKILKPWNWLFVGISLILSLPIKVLGEVGILSNKMVVNFTDHPLFKGIVSIIGLIAALATIVKEWEILVIFLTSVVEM